MNSSSDRYLKQYVHFTQFVSVVLFIGLLYFGRDVLIPFALGSLFAFFLTPLVNRLQRLGLSNVLSVITSGTIFFGLVVLFLVGLSTSLTGFTDELPKYSDQVKSKVETFKGFVRSYGTRLSKVAEEISQTMEEDSEGPQKTTGAAENKDSSDQVDGDTDNETRAPDNTSLEGTSNRSNTSDMGEPRNRESAEKSQFVNDGSSPNRPLYVETRKNLIDWKTWAGSATAIFGPLGTAGLVTVVALFALIYRDDIRDRFVSVVSQGSYVITADALDEASAKIGKYLLAQGTLNVSYGIVFGIGLVAIGYFFTPAGYFPYVTILASLAGGVRFIPYLGPLIGAVVPLSFSILIFPGFSVTIAVGILILIMELISNNVVEPWLYGSSTGVSPMAVIVAAIFWGWLWGPIGILLATPLTVCFVVLGKHVPRFRFLATLFSDEIPIPPSVRGYQRLLSGDQHKIDLFVKEELEKKEISKLLDENLVPLIKLIESDGRKRERDTAEIYKKLEKSLEEAKLIESGVTGNHSSVNPQVATPFDAEPSTNDPANSNREKENKEILHHPLLVIIPASHRGEMLVSHVIRQAINAQYRSVVIDTDDLLDREARQIMTLKPDVVLICVIPPQGLVQARFWASQLRQSGFEGSIIVACFGRFRRFDKLFGSFRKRGVSWLVTSAQQLLNKLTFLNKKLETISKNQELSTHNIPVAPGKTANH